MRVLVTGGRGKVGRAACAALMRAGHDVRSVDLAPGIFERPDSDAPEYVQAQLTDAGDTFAVIRGVDAVVHAAAFPEPTHNPPHAVFHNNMTSTFNVIEAAVRWDVSRVVYLSSETVQGFVFAERKFLPSYLPIDEDHPVRPQDPYALSKHFGEQLMDAAVARSDVRCISIRPSWVQWEGNYERNLGPIVRDPAAYTPNYWAYIDLYDLADAIVAAVDSRLPGHETFYIASPDTAGGHPLAELVREFCGDAIELRATERVDASSISCAKARKMLGYTPSRSWSDYLNADGHLTPDAASRIREMD